MAELDDTASPGHNLIREVGSSTSPPVPQKPAASLLPKAAFLAAIAVLLPLFPSQAPEFFSETLLTRSWELIHLVLVGIAVSYGLFSSRNAGGAAEKELPCKSGDSPQSYVSELLQVSPVFNDDDGEIHRSHPHRSKLQMWTSQYNGEDSTVLVAEDGGRRRRRRRRQASASTCPELERGPREKAEPAGDAVLASPIPWRSRSQRMEMELLLHSDGHLLPRGLSRRLPLLRWSRRPSPGRARGKAEEELPPAPTAAAAAAASSSASFLLLQAFLLLLRRQGIPQRLQGRIESDPRRPYRRRRRRRRSRTLLWRRGLRRFPRRRALAEEDEVLEGVVVSASEDSDGDDSDLATPEENEVDKKADEFIAKFREQIRLQRIENMKRSSAGKGGSRRNP
ncbi:unnamed protein product [Spirodela intermedia]|uniref:Uncharacterized protein n=1 Tax=Spirodela intermedia TaxID=51605 RepID=A0A7I8IGJ6_SPIIN|nr:unnamed protein product [Spirodela intermedia]CAA6656414.1 unnamed protein product [Spirodela intermedia]